MMKDETVGLKRGTVKVVNYNPDWQDAFEAEKQNLLDAIGDHVSGTGELFSWF